MSKHSVEEVRAHARMLRECRINTEATRDRQQDKLADICDAYADLLERIKADEVTVTNDIARKAYAALETEGDPIKCMRKALIAVWPTPPAQAAQVDACKFPDCECPTSGFDRLCTVAGRVIEQSESAEPVAQSEAVSKALENAWFAAADEVAVPIRQYRNVCKCPPDDPFCLCNTRWQDVSEGYFNLYSTTDESREWRTLFARPPAQAAQFDRARETPRRQQAVEMLLELGWTYNADRGWEEPAQVAQGEDWRIGMFDRWRAAAQEKGYAGIAEAITAAPSPSPGESE